MCSRTWTSSRRCTSASPLARKSLVAVAVAVDGGEDDDADVVDDDDALVVRLRGRLRVLISAAMHVYLSCCTRYGSLPCQYQLSMFMVSHVVASSPLYFITTVIASTVQEAAVTTISIITTTTMMATMTTMVLTIVVLMAARSTGTWVERSAFAPTLPFRCMVHSRAQSCSG
jgi:hypothetical protein